MLRKMVAIYAGLGNVREKLSCELRQAAASAGLGLLSKRYKACCDQMLLVWGL